MQLGRAVLFLAGVTWVCGERPTECGLRPLVDAPVPSRVVGGQEALRGAWPWQVSLQLRSQGSYHHVCGGIIVDRRWVLSAAHCFNSKARRRSQYVVLTGLHVRSLQSPHTQTFRLGRVVLHPGFNIETFSNDIALLKVRRRIVYDDFTQPICLPDNSSAPGPLDLCYISGWGSTEANGPGTEVLQEAQLKVIPNQVCNMDTWYNGIIQDSMVCAGYEDGSVDTCQGDSGGPLQCYNYKDCRFYLVGLSSFGALCAVPRKVGVYTRLSSFTDWIQQVMAIYGDGASSRGPHRWRLLLPLLAALQPWHWTHRQ